MLLQYQFLDGDHGCAMMRAMYFKHVNWQFSTHEEDSMYAIGEHVIHPGQGVCTVIDIKLDAPTPMIVLSARSGHNETRIQYPLSQQDKLHPAISPAQAHELLECYDHVETDSFCARNSALEEAHFREQMRLGASESVRVAKTMRERIAVAQHRGKKPSSYYARVLKEAHRRARAEIACVLDMSEDELDNQIDDAVAHAAQ